MLDGRLLRFVYAHMDLTRRLPEGKVSSTTQVDRVKALVQARGLRGRQKPFVLAIVRHERGGDLDG